MRVLYICTDEAGNFDFSPSGTKNFVLTFLSTTDPEAIAHKLSSLRYQLLPSYQGGDRFEENGFFHASEDRQDVRNAVFAALLDIKTDMRVDTIIAEKCKTDPKYYKNHERFYSVLAEGGLKYILQHWSEQQYDHVVVVLSSIFNRKRRGALKQAFKSVLKRYAAAPFSVYFHQSGTDFCNQAADYFGWAVYRKWERNDTRAYEPVAHLIKTEHQAFSDDQKNHY